MNDPREILERIERRRRRQPGPDAPRTPAPTAIPVPPSPTAPPDATARQRPPVQPVPRPVGGHALYTELMRSHDRMGTRHLKREQ